MWTTALMHLFLIHLVLAQGLRWDPKGIDIHLTSLPTTIDMSGNTVRTQLNIGLYNPPGKAGGVTCESVFFLYSHQYHQVYNNFRRQPTSTLQVTTSSRQSYYPTLEATIPTILIGGSPRLLVTYDAELRMDGQGASYTVS
jgi:hypothetical protein